MPTKHRSGQWKRIFLALAAIVLLAALYFLVYDISRRLAGRPDAVTVVPEDRISSAVPAGDYSHLPQNGSVAAATSTSDSAPEPDLPIPPGPAIATPPVPTPPGPVPADANDLPSALLDSSGTDTQAGVSSALSFGSFQENFVGTADIDEEKTTLYRDDVATAMFFAPDYSWETATDDLVGLFRNSFPDIGYNDFNGPYEDKRCLGNDCLTQQGTNLFYNGQSLSLPAALRGFDVAALSLGALTDNWLVGFTIRDGDGYKGRVFYFDGEEFSPLVSFPEISSPAFGLFGFGGTENDFLVIYGASAAAAYHIRNGSARDISRWFSGRIMDKGFKPEVIRVVRGGDVGWYIYSSTLSRKQMIKLWQNGTNEVTGEAVFSGLLLDTPQPSVGFKLVSAPSDRVILLASFKGGAGSEWRVFTDRGFKNDSSATLVTRPITHDGSASPVIIDRIADARLGIDHGSLPFAQFSFSEDGKLWQKILLGPFKTGKIKDYRLQVAFPAFSDRFYSPFLDSILFDYYAKKF